MGVKSIMTNEAVEMEPSGRVLPIFRGEYDADRTYENPDIVLFRNSSYVAKQVTVGNPPPTDALADDYWQMVAKGIIDADVSDSTIEFTEATKRSNIESGEKSNIIMGKIMKFFTELKDSAFSGRYSDLSDKPISITEDGNDSIISLEGGEQRSIGLINQLQAVNFKNEGGGPNQGMKFVTRQPSTGDIVFGNLDGDTDLMFPFSFGIDENGDYGYKKFKTNKFTPFGNVYTKNVLNTTEQISANTASGNIAGALAAKAMMADYNAKINQINSNFNNYLPAYFEYVGSVEGIGNSLDIPRGAKELYIIGNTPYYSVPMLLTAGQLTMYETILGGGSHYVRFSVNRNGSGKIVITDAMQDGSISNNARIALWYR